MEAIYRGYLVIGHRITATFTLLAELNVKFAIGYAWFNINGEAPSGANLRQWYEDKRVRWIVRSGHASH